MIVGWRISGDGSDGKAQKGYRLNNICYLLFLIGSIIRNTV